MSSVNPLGRALKSDLSEEFNGSWMGSEGNQLQIHCESDGALTFAVTEWKNDEGKFVLETGRGVLRAIGDHVVFNYAEAEHEYEFLLIHNNDGQLVAWSPDVERFRTMVDEETLAGRVEDDGKSIQVVLTGTSEDITVVLEKLDLATLFEWDEPTIALVRINKD